MRHHPLNTILLALAAGLTMAACDRRDDVPTAVIDAPSEPAGTTGNPTTSTAASPDAAVQQNPTGSGGVTTPGGTMNDITGTPPGMSTTMPAGSNSGNSGTTGTTGAPSTDSSVQSPNPAAGSGTGLNTGSTGTGGAGTGLNTNGSGGGNGGTGSGTGGATGGSSSGR